MACLGKSGSMLTFDDNIIRFIQTKKQKKYGETINKTSISLIQVAQLDVSWMTTNCIMTTMMMIRFSNGRRFTPCTLFYLTFLYKCAKYLLHIPLYPTTAIITSLKPRRLLFLNPKQWNYFKSIHHVCRM